MPKQDLTRTSTLNIRIGATQKAEIAKYAKARDMNLGEFVRHALWQYLETTSVDPYALTDRSEG